MNYLRILLNKQIYAIDIIYVCVFTLEMADITSNVYTVINGLYYAPLCLLLTGRKLHGNKNGLMFVLKN